MKRSSAAVRDQPALSLPARAAGITRLALRKKCLTRRPKNRKGETAAMLSFASVQRLEDMVRLQRTVARLACAIARKMDLTDDQVETVHAGARLHDIGELGLPASLFMKQSRFTRQEYVRVRDHCQIGFDMIRDVDCPWPVSYVVLQHHERMNGSGYPDGLEGCEIALAARVVAVADVVSAICSNRPYKSAQSVEFALDELRGGRTSLYDGDAVDACLSLFIEDGFTWPPSEQPPSPLFSEWVGGLQRAARGADSAPGSS